MIGDGERDNGDKPHTAFFYERYRPFFRFLQLSLVCEVHAQHRCREFIPASLWYIPAYKSSQKLNLTYHFFRRQSYLMILNYSSECGAESFIQGLGTSKLHPSPRYREQS